MCGINAKRMTIALIMAAIFGVFCAYGTSTMQIPGFVVTMPYLYTIFYARLLIGFVIGLSENVKFLKGNISNAIVRGALWGAIMSISISFYGGAEAYITAGIVYGIITDVVATALSTKKKAKK